MDELVIGEKRYVSSKKAAEITGYAKDYVGQLCREGYVEAKMVGRSWYVLETSIQEHRFGGSSSKGEAMNQPFSNASAREDEGNTVAGGVVSTPESAQSPVLDWQRPVYRPEEPTPMPQIETRPEPATAVQGHSGALAQNTEDSIAGDTALSDMQDAWKEWFEQKRGETQDAASQPNEPVDEEDEDSGEDTEEETVDASDDEEYEAKYSDVGISEDEDEVSVQNDRYESKGAEKDEPVEEGFEIPIQRQREVPAEDLFENESGTSEKSVQIPLRRMRAAEEGIIHEERIVKKRGGNRPERAPRGNTGAKSSVLLRTMLIAVAGIVIAIAIIGSGLASTGSNPVVDFLGGTSTVNK